MKRDDYKDFGLVALYILPKHTDTDADSGAMSCLCSRFKVLICGFSLKDLLRSITEWKQ